MKSRYFKVIAVTLTGILTVLSILSVVPINETKASTQLTVIGKWEYKNRHNSWVDADRFLVALVTGSYPDYQYLDWKYTSNNGEFELGPVTDPGENFRVQIYTVRLYADAELLCVYEDGFDVPVHRVEAPSAPIEINLSISEAPALNVPAKLTCTLSSRMEAPNTTARVKLPTGATLISGPITW